MPTSEDIRRVIDAFKSRWPESIAPHSHGWIEDYREYSEAHLSRHMMYFIYFLQAERPVPFTQFNQRKTTRWYSSGRIAKQDDGTLPDPGSDTDEEVVDWETRSMELCLEALREFKRPHHTRKEQLRMDNELQRIRRRQQLSIQRANVMEETAKREAKEEDMSSDDGDGAPDNDESHEARPVKVAPKNEHGAKDEMSSHDGDGTPSDNDESLAARPVKFAPKEQVKLAVKIEMSSAQSSMPASGVQSSSMPATASGAQSSMPASGAQSSMPASGAHSSMSAPGRAAIAIGAGPSVSRRPSTQLPWRGAPCAHKRRMPLGPIGRGPRDENTLAPIRRRRGM